MADVVYQCTQCERKITVSEYADAATLTCPDCGNPELARAVAGADGGPGPGRPLRLRPRTRDAEGGSAGPAKKNATPRPPTQADIMKDAFGPVRKVPGHTYKGGIWSVLGAWLLFFGIGGITYVLRFQEIGLPGEFKPLLRDYAWIPLAVLWLVTVAAAVRDSVFAGILCLMIPGFFLYYLMIRDHFYLRAVTFGLLVGFGYDTALLVQEGWDMFYTGVSEWIASGGGD